jgi:hypothetical protein
MLAIKNALVFLECFLNFYLIRSFLSFLASVIISKFFIKAPVDQFFSKVLLLCLQHALQKTEKMLPNL